MLFYTCVIHFQVKLPIYFCILRVKSLGIKYKIQKLNKIYTICYVPDTWKNVYKFAYMFSVFEDTQHIALLEKQNFYDASRSCIIVFAKDCRDVIAIHQV